MEYLDIGHAKGIAEGVMAVFPNVRPSVIRQCLKLLEDREIDELLSFSASLHDAIRRSSAMRKGEAVTTAKFKRWLSIPAQSDMVLSSIATNFAKEAQSRSTKSCVALGVAAKALVFLSQLPAGSDLVGPFAEKLDELRTEESESLVETEDDPCKDGSARVTASELAQLAEKLRGSANSLSEQLLVVVGEVRDGRVATNLHEQVEAWNQQLVDVWSRLNIDPISDRVGFDEMRQLENELLDSELATAAEQELHTQKLNELAELQAMVASLTAEISEGGPLAKHKASFRVSAEQSIEQLRDELGLTDVDPTQENRNGASEHRSLQHEVPGSVPPDSAPSESAEPYDPAGLAPEIEPVTPVLQRVHGSEIDDATLVVESAQSTRMAESQIVEIDSAELVLPETFHSDDVDRENGEAARCGLDPVVAELDVVPIDGVSSARLPGDGDETLDETTETAPTEVGKSLPQLVVGNIQHELEHHVHAENYAAAWWVARATGLPEADCAAYRIAAAAFNSGPGGLDPVEVLAMLAEMPENEHFSSPQAAQVALAATLRAALTAGWLPRSELEKIDKQANVDASLRTLIDEVIGAGDRNYKHLQTFSDGPSPTSEDARLRARALKDKLSKFRISFARANKVQRHLLRDSEPLGAALNAIESGATGEERRIALSDALVVLRSPDEIIDAADQITSTPQQRRKLIVAHARGTLHRNIESVAECVTDAIRSETLTADNAEAASAHGLLSAAKEVEVEGTDVGARAMRHLIAWITNPEHPRSVSLTVDDALRTASLPIVDVVRDTEGMPLLDAANAVYVVESLRNPSSSEVLFGKYIQRGDLERAQAAGRHHPDLLSKIPEETQVWQRRLSREVKTIRAELARTTAADITQSTANVYSEWEAALVAPSSYSGPRFDLQMRILDELTSAFARRRARSAESLRGRLRDEIADPADRDRVEALIEAEDFIGAYELLALAKAENHLPPMPPNEGNAFDDFMTALPNLSSTMSIREVMAALGEGAESAANDLGRLNAWTHLQEMLNPRHNRRAEHLSAILRASGLDLSGAPNPTTPKGVRHYARVQVSATPIDGSLVPGLGSQASHYDVVIASDPKQLTQILMSAYPSNRGPNILLFDGVLSAEQRRKCLATCREHKISAIVIDYAVSAFVATHYPQSFKVVQQLALPFTCFSHYTVVAGNVPDEVFVGRAEELTDLAARDGSLFVYGGRQLGKSALLRKIQRDFSSVPDQHAVFIDLNAHGIGSWAEPSQLWPVLFEELRHHSGIVPKGVSNVRTASKVVQYIQDWLKAKDTRRLLVLLDEADAFLDKESRTTKGRFANIYPLKGLFDDFAGRFKPVFAGLHKVQRLQNVSNTPLAHGGRDILIGPLGAAAARDLVVKPLEALGYRFENPELIWGLLAFTNMQAGLIQVVCTDLVKHMQSRPLRSSEPFVTITSNEIDTVTSQPKTREKIAEKLRLTIELEERYRVITVAIAIQSMEDDFTEQYTVDDIQALCELYWLEGFEELNSSQFALYLDELVGLGVLIEGADQSFAVRSPNIVTMLGTKDQLSRELVENRQQFELPQEYNAQATRRTVKPSTRKTAIHSPLSEHDLATLLPRKDRYEARTFSIVGSDALGINDVTTVLAEVANERNLDVQIIDGETDNVGIELGSFKFSSPGAARPRILVINATMAHHATADRIAQAVAMMPRRNRGHLVVVFGPAGVTAALRMQEMPSEAIMIPLQKWSGDGLRAWIDNPLSARADERKVLLTHSGGWPELVASAVRAVSGGSSLKEQWEHLGAFPSNSADADQFLRNVGLADEHRYLLRQWTQLVEPGDFQPLGDIADIIGADVAETQGIADELAVLGILTEWRGTYAVDRVVARAVHAL